MESLCAGPYGALIWLNLRHPLGRPELTGIKAIPGWICLIFGARYRSVIDEVTVVRGQSFDDGSQRPLRPSNGSRRAAGEPLAGCLIVFNILEYDEELLDRQQMADLPSWRQPPDSQAIIATQVRRELREDLKAIDVRVVEGATASTIDAMAREVGGHRQANSRHRARRAGNC